MIFVSAYHVNDTINFFQDYHNQIVLAFIWFLGPALPLYDFRRIFKVSLVSIFKIISLYNKLPFDWFWQEFKRQITKFTNARIPNQRELIITPPDRL